MLGYVFVTDKCSFVNTRMIIKSSIRCGTPSGKGEGTAKKQAILAY